MNFFQEYQQLREKTPIIGLNTVQNENSQYCQYTEKSKGCYMTFASYQSEDCMYNHRVFYCTDCNDCTLSYKCELCYESVDCVGSYNCNHCIYCENAIDCDHCHYCIGVNDCFGCVGLQQKKFHIFNQQVTQTEYKKRLPELRKMPAAEIKSRLEELFSKVPRAAMYGKHNEESYGENIHHCKEVFWAFDSKYLWDCYYNYHCDESKNLYDCSHLGWSEMCYQIMSGGNLTNSQFCYGCWFSNNLEYCELVYNSHDCFGCIGINHAEYCIFNQPYPEAKYHKKMAEIKAAMQKDGSYGKWFESTYPEVITYGL